MDGFHYLNRRPWLPILLGIAVVVAVVLLWRKFHTERHAGLETTTDRGVAVVERRDSQAQASAPASVSSHVVNAASVLETRGDLAGARRAYLALLEQALPGPLCQDVEGRLGRIATELVFSPKPMPEKVEYVVLKGDSVDKIAKKFGTTAELIQRGNGIGDPKRIQVGSRLKILKGKFSIVVSKSRYDLLLKLNNEFFKRYSVGTGKEGKTPLGEFTIWDKQKEPTWFPEGRVIPYGHPDNMLGTRWMAIQPTGNMPKVQGYGIHGTWDTNSIGKAESAGCIRMKNSDVEEVFSLVPVNTPVTIVE